MIFKKWTTGIMAAGLALVATACQAAPMPVATTVIEAAPQRLEHVQYYGYGDDDDYAPRRAYGPPPYRHGPPPAHGYYAPPAYGHRYGPPAYGYRDYVKDQKEIVKEQRRYQKEVLKERARYWNRTHGFQ
jgi:hypothetical protein